jgi:hypothetical protein
MNEAPDPSFPGCGLRWKIYTCTMNTVHFDALFKAWLISNYCNKIYHNIVKNAGYWITSSSNYSYTTCFKLSYQPTDETPPISEEKVRSVDFMTTVMWKDKHFYTRSNGMMSQINEIVPHDSSLAKVLSPPNILLLWFLFSSVKFDFASILFVDIHAISKSLND